MTGPGPARLEGVRWVDRIPWQVVSLAGLVGALVLARYVELRAGSHLR